MENELKNKLTKCKTIHQGFSKYIYNYPNNVLVADIFVDDYYIRNDSEILITYGIITCCGLVVIDENKLMLMHLASDIDGDDVLKVLQDNNFSNKLQVLLAPGFACYVNYDDILNKINDRIDKLYIQKFNGKYGVIYIDEDDLVIGNDKSIEKRFKLRSQKIYIVD